MLIYVVIKLSFQVDKFLEKCIGNGNDTAVCLETTLCGDHFGEFCRKVNITHFEYAGCHVTAV